MTPNYSCCECSAHVEPDRVAIGARNCATCSRTWRERAAREARRFGTDYMPARARRALRDRVRP